MAENIAAKQFVCPVCGSKKYVANYSDDGIKLATQADRRSVANYSCAGCSVVFGNPKLFGEGWLRKNK